MLVLANVINTYSTDNIADKFREISTVVDGFRGFAYAVVGKRGALKPLIKISASCMYFTATEHDARNWLVKQAKQQARKHIYNRS